MAAIKRRNGCNRLTTMGGKGRTSFFHKIVLPPLALQVMAVIERMAAALRRQPLLFLLQTLPLTREPMRVKLSIWRVGFHFWPLFFRRPQRFCETYLNFFLADFWNFFIATLPQEGH
jgi:hypothetical protein